MNAQKTIFFPYNVLRFFQLLYANDKTENKKKKSQVTVF